MTLPDRAGNAEKWEFDKLVTILLRQFKRLLAARGVDLEDKRMQQIGQEVAAHNASADELATINSALYAIIHQSIDVLAKWNLTFVQSLNTQMTDMQNWETTADFLDVANEKINAEVRISAGASLMVALGDYRHTNFLLQAIDYDLNTHGRLDVDAMLAKRVLLFAAQVDISEDDWLAQVKTWAETHM